MTNRHPRAHNGARRVTAVAVRGITNPTAAINVLRIVSPTIAVPRARHTLGNTGAHIKLDGLGAIRISSTGNTG